MEEYNPKIIESKWRKIWSEQSDLWRAKDFSKKPKYYTLFEFPYPSGDGLHMGHLRGQTAVDAIGRKKRLEGFNVMNPIGWDAFGLPTENYAIKHKIQPSKATHNNIESIKKQEKSLGYLLDWDREINTSDPDYYKWTQWIFLKLYEHGLAYKKAMPINWCPSCKIGLANEEVIDEKCERCGESAIKRNVSQWMLRITKYADKLIDGLNDLDFPDRVKSQQINWIGRSEGVIMQFPVILNQQAKNLAAEILLRQPANQDDTNTIEVFTTRPDTIYGATFMVVAPEHQLITDHGSRITNKKEVDNYINATKNKSDLERTDLAKDKTGIEIKGIKAINPVNNEEIPIFVADYVLSSYGSGAIMAVPAHDERDYEFATKYHLPIIEVVKPIENNQIINNKTYFTGEGISINSELINGLKTPEAIDKITKWLEDNQKGKNAVSYKLRDWIFSRQHYWGEPIPVVFCDKCGTVTVPEKDLPVELPKVENYQPTDNGESPLAKITDWVNTKCPKCGGPAKRETDTMPNWAGSSWYYLRYIDPKNDINFVDQKKMKYWLDDNGIDLYEGGMEHTTLHLLYSRFWHQFLYDIGAVPTREPYAKRVPHGVILAADGRKMSKSFGNVVRPDRIISKYGADTARTYMMFIGPFDQSIAWDESGLRGVYRFLNKVWQNIYKSDGDDTIQVKIAINKLITEITGDIDRYSFNTAIAKLMEFNNLLSRQVIISNETKKTFLILLSPFAPHIAEELYSLVQKDKTILNSSWPRSSTIIKSNNQVNLVVAINSKKRGVLHIDSNLSQDKAIDLIISDLKYKNYLTDRKQILKVIYVPNRIINILTK